MDMFSVVCVYFGEFQIFVQTSVYTLAIKSSFSVFTLAHWKKLHQFAHSDNTAQRLLKYGSHTFRTMDHTAHLNHRLYSEKNFTKQLSYGHIYMMMIIGKDQIQIKHIQHFTCVYTRITIIR